MSDAERYIHEQLAGQLKPGESILHCAALTSAFGGTVGALSAKGYLAALTELRIVMIETRIGALKPLLENHGVTSIARSDIAAAVTGQQLQLRLRDGTDIVFLSQTRAKKHVPSHPAFMAALAEVHGQGEVAQQMAKEHKRGQVIGVVIAVVIVAAVASYRYHFNRAEVAVACNVVESRFDCELRHTAGAADAHVCWNVAVGCNNGKRATASACGDVESGQTITIAIEESAFVGIADCDGVTSAAVENLVVTVE